MTREFKLEMTLIEGHANVLIKVGDDGRLVDRVLYQAVDTRFFEKLWIGMNVDELPRVTPMICGVCSATHHVCSALAVDKVHGLKPPETAQNIRLMINAGIHLNNQALHLIVMGLPDFLPIETRRRSIFHLMRKNPELVKTGLKLMELGHRVVAVFGGREVHPVNAVAGGVARAPEKSEVERLKREFEEAKKIVQVFRDEALKILEESKSKVAAYESGTKYAMAVVDERDGGFELLEGRLRIIDEKGNTIVEFRPEEYTKVFEEKTLDYTYVKTPVLRSVGYPEGAVKVGPLARLNIVRSYYVEEADELRDKLFEEWGKPAFKPLLYHYARVVETVALVELIHRWLNELDFWSPPLREYPEKGGEGIAAIEAPRGTLIHHYRADDKFNTEYINIITPTAFNAPAMENDLTAFFRGKNILEMSDREIYYHAVAIVRPFDPCMACATHALAETQLGKILIVDSNYNVVREVRP